jgi:mRNA interferase HigB
VCVRIIARNTLVTFWATHPAAEASLRHWHEVAVAAEWQSPLDVVADFSKAKSLNGERVRFELAGGDFRMVVAFDWRRGIAFIKFIGSHAEYDRIDALTVQLF